MNKVQYTRTSSFLPLLSIHQVQQKQSRAPEAATNSFLSLPSTQQEVEGLVSVAMVTVNVTRADHGAVVSCKAENPAVPGSALKNTTNLVVECE